MTRSPVFGTRPALAKRAILFSLMSILLSTFFILLFWSASAPRLDHDAAAIATRVAVMDRYVTSWDSYVEDAARITTRQALAGLAFRLSDEGPGWVERDVDDVVDALNECLLTGLSDYPAGGQASGCAPEGVASSLPSRLDRYAALADSSIDINTTYTISSRVAVVDWAPLQLGLSFTVNTTFTDESGLSIARWNRTRVHTVIVDLNGLPDPLFELYGEKVFPSDSSRHRNMTLAEKERDQLNLSDFKTTILLGRYVANPRFAPTYLQRLAGKIDGADGDPFDPTGKAGVESFIDPDETAPSWLDPDEYRNVSFTDHQVFAEKRFACGEPFGTFGIKNLGVRGFHLDDERLARYNIVVSAYNQTCS